MTRLSRIIIFLAAALCAVVARGADYNVTLAKAARFFENKEWASASAMYDLLLDERPGTTNLYARAIVSAEMRRSVTDEMRLLENALHQALPFDSVMTHVKTVSLECGNIEAYRNFLINAQKEYPWLSRAIDRYLLEYYTFRRNGPMMVRYSSLILKGLPDDVSVLGIKAKGYLYDNNPARAMDIYTIILEKDPSNFEALSALGIYSAHKGAKGLAREYLTRAEKIHSTPYIAEMLKNL